MYIPAINRLDDEDEIFRFIRENSFAIIISEEKGEIIATHAPVELEENDKKERILRTHIAKSNPQWKMFRDNKDVLVIFNGPHTYISSSWYDHVNVPTWNYIAIHVYGKTKIFSDKEATALLKRLVDRHEQFSEKPFRMETLTEEYMRSHLKALVAFEITIDRIDAKQKLSQNRNEKNYDLILEQLQKRDDDQSKAVKNEMERVKKERFGENNLVGEDTDQ